MRDRDAALLRGVFELAVASVFANFIPTISFNLFDDFAAAVALGHFIPLFMRMIVRMIDRISREKCA